MTYKHTNPVHLKFGKSGDSSLLRKGYAKGGAVNNDDDPFKPGMSDADAILAADRVGNDLLYQAGQPGIYGNPDWAVIAKRRGF